MKKTTWVVAAGALLVLLPLGYVMAQDEEKPYTVECEGNSCKVDKETFVGWRTFHANCHVCHAQDAVGSTFAPSLIEAMQRIDHERFMYVLEEGYQGQLGVMPGWKENPNVNDKFEELYGYLKARADGVLLPGRPERLE